MFDSARQRLSRAAIRHRELIVNVDEWVSSLSLEPERHPDRIDLILRSSKPMPAELALNAGDALHSARAALDHAVYEVVGKPGHRGVQFPVWNQRGSFDHQWPKYVQKCAPGEGAAWLRAELEKLEPRAGGRDAWIYTLHDLDIADKHHGVLAVSTFTVSTRVAIRADVAVLHESTPDAPADYYPNTPAALLDVTYTQEATPPMEPGAVVHTMTHEAYEHLQKFERNISLTLTRPGVTKGEELTVLIGATIKNASALLDRLAAAAP